MHRVSAKTYHRVNFFFAQLFENVPTENNNHGALFIWRRISWVIECTMYHALLRMSYDFVKMQHMSPYSMRLFIGNGNSKEIERFTRRTTVRSIECSKWSANKVM